MENNKLHILVVDDDDRIRSLLKEYLNENNFIVSTAENSEEAKKKLSYLQPKEKLKIELKGLSLVLMIISVNLLSRRNFY